MRFKTKSIMRALDLVPIVNYYPERDHYMGMAYNSLIFYRTGTFVPMSPVGSTSNCPSTGIKYLPKSGSPAPTTSSGASSTSTSSASPTTTSGASPTTSSPTSTPTGGSGTFSGSGTLDVQHTSNHLLTLKGYLNAYTNGSQVGCLISSGTWYTSGTCATYTAKASGRFVGK